MMMMILLIERSKYDDDILIKISEYDDDVSDRMMRV